MNTWKIDAIFVAGTFALRHFNGTENFLRVDPQARGAGAPYFFSATAPEFCP
jgi:hypothetical protein